MIISCAFYQEFYEMWYDCLLKKEYNGIYPQKMGERSPALLTYSAKDADACITTDLFRGLRAYKADYFYTKKIELNPEKKIQGPFDDKSLFKGLEYIEFYKPEDSAKWGKMKWREQLSILYEAFLKRYNIETNEKENSKSAIPYEQVGYHISKLNVFKQDVRDIASANQGELYYSIKKELTIFFAQIENEFPTLAQAEYSILDAEEEQIVSYELNEELKAKLFDYIFDDTKSKERRKKALTVFCYHKGLSDEQIIKLVKAKEQGISRLALDRLPELVTTINDRAFICKEVVSFASDSEDVGITRRVGEQLFFTDFIIAIKELPRLFPANEIGFPKHTIERLWAFLDQNPKALKTAEIAKQTLHLATICLNYHPKHSKLLANFLKIENLIKTKFPDFH